MDNNRHICQWEDYMNKAKESLENKNFEEYKDLLKKACDTVDLYKNDCDFSINKYTGNNNKNIKLISKDESIQLI